MLQFVQMRPIHLSSLRAIGLQISESTTASLSLCKHQIQLRAKINRKKGRLTSLAESKWACVSFLCLLQSLAACCLVILARLFGG